jgi:predicted phosphodiesterase
MDVDVLLWGGTHKFEAYELEGKFFVNPGSATGAFTSTWTTIDEEPVPSFCLMDVRLRTTLNLFSTAYHYDADSRRCTRIICVSITDRCEWE